MKTIWVRDQTRLLEYAPTVFKPLDPAFEPMRTVRWLRFFLEYISPGKYRVFYLEKFGVLVGYCVVTPGGRRLKCSTEKDLVLGPYYIKASERGKGYSKELIRLVLEHSIFEAVYDWIEKDNYASRKASEACGFVPVAELDVTRFLRKLVITEHGKDIVYRYQKTESEE